MNFLALLTLLAPRVLSTILTLLALSAPPHHSLPTLLGLVALLLVLVFSLLPFPLSVSGVMNLFTLKNAIEYMLIPYIVVKTKKYLLKRDRTSLAYNLKKTGLVLFLF